MRVILLRIYKQQALQLVTMYVLGVLLPILTLQVVITHFLRMKQIRGGLIIKQAQNLCIAA